MQINSAQDYLTLKKRQIIAATFTQNPPPVKRRNNTIVTALLANKATGYEKVPYAISLAPGTAPGPAYVFPGLRPTVNNCCIQPSYIIPGVAAVYTYYPDQTGPTNNTVATLITNSTVIPEQSTLATSDSSGTIFVINQTKLYKLPFGASSFTEIATISPGPGNGSASQGFPDGLGNFYYTNRYTINEGFTIKKLNLTTGVLTTITPSPALSTVATNTDAIYGASCDSTGNFYLQVVTVASGYLSGPLLKITPGGVLSTFTTLTWPQNGGLVFAYSATTDTIYLHLGGSFSEIYAIPVSTGVQTLISNQSGYNGSTYVFIVSPQGTHLYLQKGNTIWAVNISTGIKARIAGPGSGATGYTDGAGNLALFSNGPSSGVGMGFLPDGTLYVIDPTNSAIRTVKGPTVTVSPAIPTVFPKAGALI